MEQLSVQEAREGPTAVLVLRGSLDLATVPILRERSGAALHSSTSNKLVLDLGQVHFLDSTGIGCFVALQRLATDSGKQFALRSIPPNIARLLDITGIGGRFAESPRTSS